MGLRAYFTGDPIFQRCSQTSALRARARDRAILCVRRALPAAFGRWTSVRGLGHRGGKQVTGLTN
eukprot:1993415-Alexandrium_andersonii.AAC.1